MLWIRASLRKKRERKRKEGGGRDEGREGKGKVRQRVVRPGEEKDRKAWNPGVSGSLPRAERRVNLGRRRIYRSQYEKLDLASVFSMK